MNTDYPAAPTDTANVVASPYTPRPRKRLRGLSVRMLMLLVLAVGGWLGWSCYRARVRREAVAAIKRAGGQVLYDWEWDTTTLGPKFGSSNRGWLRRHLGPGFFEEVMDVNIPEADDTLMVQIGRLRHLQGLTTVGRNLTDAGLAPIAGLADLRWLLLHETRITDAGLATIAGLRNLRCLSLAHTQITDACLIHLTGLKHCGRVVVTDTKVTPEGITALKAKCPWMKINEPPGMP